MNFGTASYRDGVDLSADQFYQKLQQSDFLPTTSQPSPADFEQMYRSIVADADGIVSIHISQQLSGTYNSALLGREALSATCPPIEVIDSRTASMGLGLVVIQAARAAQVGAGLDDIVEVTRRAIGRTHFFGMVDTLAYLQKGGRIGKAQALVGTLLNVKPIIGCKDGEVLALGKERTRKRGIGRLVEMVESFKSIQDLAILHTTMPDEAESLINRFSGMVDRQRIISGRIGPVIGTYLGPGVITVGVVEGD